MKRSLSFFSALIAVASMAFGSMALAETDGVPKMDLSADYQVMEFAPPDIEVPLYEVKFVEAREDVSPMAHFTSDRMSVAIVALKMTSIPAPTPDFALSGGDGYIQV